MKFKYFLITLVTSVLLISCTSSKDINSKNKIINNYTSVFPNNEVSDEIEDIISSIKRINNITFYKRYDFEDGIVTVKDLSKKNVLDKAYMISNISKTSSGTSAVISVSGSSIALLTAAHIVSYPDTVLGYYTDNGVSTKFIESIAIKVRQQIYGDLPNGGALRILAKDTKTDIAVVGNSLGGFTPLNAHELKFKFGSAQELKWGSFIYIFGFPMGNKMVTRGIVSSPNKRSDNSFLVDAVINKGSSGG